MATMHQRGSPLTSGRTVLWRTIPVLFISPILSSFVNGHDLKIYLPVTYGFLTLAIIQYRNLCHEWSTWQEKIPKLSEQDVLDWYSHREKQARSASDDESTSPLDSSTAAQAQLAFRSAVASCRRKAGPTVFGGERVDSVVARISKGMPYVDWLLLKEFPESDPPEAFTPEWFNTLGEAVKKQQQLFRGLKEHSIMILFRHARYDVRLPPSQTRGPPPLIHF